MTRGHKIFQSLEEICYLWDLSKPIWLDNNIMDLNATIKPGLPPIILLRRSILISGNWSDWRVVCMKNRQTPHAGVCPFMKIAGSYSAQIRYSRITSRIICSSSGVSIWENFVSLAAVCRIPSVTLSISSSLVCSFSACSSGTGFLAGRVFSI